MTEGDGASSNASSLMVGQMTTGSQSREGAHSLNTDLLSPKHTERIACWNVRTLYQAGKLAQVVKEMHEYKISMLGITEARWTDNGKQVLTSGDTIMWSGREDGRHQEGVALLVRKENSKSLLRWKPINERLLYAQFHSKFTRLSILVAYAPTEDAEEEAKDTFYDSLQAAMDEVPKHDVLLLIGDLNARVGAENKNHEKVMGRQAVGKMNNNGERFVTLCEENKMVVGGSIFQHKNIHKLTWKSPDGKTESQIDHIAINAKWRRTLKDVRVKRQADVGSDHNLLVATLRLKLRKAKIGEERKRQYNSTALKDLNKRKEFHLTLKNRFSALAEESTPSIETFTQAIQQTGEKVLGYRKKKKEEWLSTGTWDKIEERKEIKKRLLQVKSPRLKERLVKQYSEKDKEVKKSARRDKKDYVENLAKEAEDAAKRRDLKTVYDTMKNLTGGHKNNQDVPVTDKAGNILSGE
jgi:endonuclease/exonuclease/phosphatase family metal-dependent hydrolase